jgi:hypothetical protein
MMSFALHQSQWTLRIALLLRSVDARGACQISQKWSLEND